MQPLRHPKLRIELEALLADGEWHSVSELAAALKRHVPPVDAHRRGVVQVRRERRVHGHSTTTPISDETAIRSGQWRIAYEQVMNWRKLEVRTVNGVRFARLPMHTTRR